MRRSSIVFNFLGAVGLVGLLGGCGGGGGSSSPATGSSSGSATASGTVTGFGSVIVNGKKFETNGASVTVDGQPVLSCTVNSVEQCGLKEGMVVKVSGSFNGSSHSASTITQEDTLEGPITSKNQVDASNGTLAVLGQTVIVDSTTRFDSGVSLTTLNDNDVIEVNGFVKSDGTVAASFIEQKAGVGICSPVCEVKGTVKNHDAVLATFQIGGLTVTYDTNTIIGDMPTPIGSNWNGRFVEVKGTNFSVNAGVPTLLATKVEPENQGVGNNVDEFEVEGFVTQAGTPSGEFTIGTTQVRTTANTEFRGGTVDEIVVGAKMSAEGRFDGTTLIAKHVKFHAAVKLEGNIDTINGNTFTIDGLPGITVTVNSQTEGGSNLSRGNHVRVRGRVGSSNSVIATRVEQRSPGDDVDLQGPVQAVSDPNLTILGVAVVTSTFNDDDFEGLNDQIIGRAAFFKAVEEGTLVKVQGRLTGSIVAWREAELED
jgi:hypothetical protein